MDAGVTSRRVDLDGPVHYVDFGGPAGSPPVVLVHGLGGSAANWMALGPLLARRFRVTAPDLAGFGLTPAAGRSTTVAANGGLVSRFVREVVAEPAVWVGNSMGALITTLQVGENPELARAAVLIDHALMPGVRDRPGLSVPAAFAAYAVPGVGRAIVAARAALRTPEQSVRDTMVLCCADPARIPPEVIADHVRVHRAGRGVRGRARQFEVAARSMVRILARRRHLAERARRLGVPVLVIHGGRDPLVPLRTASAWAAAHPGWRFAVIEEAGHLPMVEAPRRTADLVHEWWAGLAATR